MSDDVAKPDPKQRPPKARGSARSSICLAAALSGLITLLAFPPFGVWWLAWFAPVPVLWAADRVAAGRVRYAAACIASSLGIMPLWAWQQQWIFDVSAPGAVLLILYLSAYTGLFVTVTAWVARRWRAPVWLVGPVIWAGLEWLRGIVLFDGYPWLFAGHPIVESAALSRAGAAIGASGVSLLVLTVAGGLFGLAFTSGRRRLGGAGVLLGAACLWTIASLPAPVETDGELRVAVVQTNVPQGLKQGWPPAQRATDLDLMLAFTEVTCQIDPAPELIIWPETMFPGATLEPDAISEERAAQMVWATPADVPWPELGWTLFRGWSGFDDPQPLEAPFEQAGRRWIPSVVAADSLLAWQQRLGVPMLVGAEGIEGLRIDQDPASGTLSTQWDTRFNSSYLITGGRVADTRYDKMHLTPFGEVMPYISAWPWLESLFLRVGVGAAGMTFDLDAGDRPVWHAVPTDRGPVRIATPICFEGIVPGVCRGLTFVDDERQADLLVQLTNDGWFGDFDAGREQHLQIVRWRAVELGTSIVRAANTGVSAAIDPRGRVTDAGVKDGRARTFGVLWEALPLATGATIYARTGDIAGWGAFMAAWGLVLGAAIRSRLRKQSPAREPTDKPSGQSAT